MKNYNLFPGFNQVIAYNDMTFERAGMTEDNTIHVYKQTDQGKFLMWHPFKKINHITGFEAGSRYYISMKKPLYVECLSEPTVHYPLRVKLGLWLIKMCLPNDGMREVNEAMGKYFQK